MSSAAQFFETTGYYKVEGLLSSGMTEKMRSVVADHFARSVPPLRVNESGEVARLDSLFERDEVFLKALQEEVVLAPLCEILGSRIELVRNRHNHATMNRSGDIPFRLHRDIQQWSQPLVAVFFYLEPATKDNGCTHIVPGSHRLPYAGPQSAGGGGNWADEHPEYRHLIGQELPVEMSAGGILLLNCLCFHSVGSNATADTRRSVVFACRSVDELSQIEDPHVTQISGDKRFLANSALAISGSLRQG